MEMYCIYVNFTAIPPQEKTVLMRMKAYCIRSIRQAHWHPLQDLIVVGRYPDENLPGQVKGDMRSIDIIHPDTGAEVTRLHDSQATGLVSVSLHLLMGCTHSADVISLMPKTVSGFVIRF